MAQYSYVPEQAFFRQFAGFSIGINTDITLPHGITGFILTVVSGNSQINVVVKDESWRSSLSRHRGPIHIKYSRQLTPRQRGIAASDWLLLESATWPSCTCACKPLDRL